MENKEELKQMIEESVKSAVSKSLMKNTLRNNFLKILAYIGILAALFFMYQSLKPKTPEAIEQVEDHDVTLENNGIFGFTVADFEEPILGEATRQQLLIVDEQEVSVATTISDAGLFNWSIFAKVKNETIYGTGVYTIDLTKIKKSDISLNEDTYTVTIHVPYPELHLVNFDPSKTKIGDTEKGWLAFGDIKLTPEQTKAFEEEAVEKLTVALNGQDCFEKAARFTKLTAYELYQPIINTVSPAYKVEIIVDPKS